MKKIVKLMLSVMMIASMAACSSAPKNDQGGEGKFKAGTYTGTAPVSYTHLDVYKRQLFKISFSAVAVRT